MKPPRWLVVSLLSLSALAVLGAGAWWWITWPERTAREFVRRCVEEDCYEVNAMFAPEEACDRWGPLPTGLYFDLDRPFDEFVVNPRSIPDIAIGKSSFADPYGFGVVVERGRVTAAGLIFVGKAR